MQSNFLVQLWPTVPITNACMLFHNTVNDYNGYFWNIHFCFILSLGLAGLGVWPQLIEQKYKSQNQISEISTQHKKCKCKAMESGNSKWEKFRYRKVDAPMSQISNHSLPRADQASQPVSDSLTVAAGVWRNLQDSASFTCRIRSQFGDLLSWLMSLFISAKWSKFCFCIK